MKLTTFSVCNLLIMVGLWGEPLPWMEGVEARPAVLRSTEVTLVQGKALVTFHPAPWPNILWTPIRPWDWGGYSGLTLTVRNPGTHSVAFRIRIDDDPRADGIRFCSTSVGIIAAGQEGQYFLPFQTQDPLLTWGMRAGPPEKGFDELTRMTSTGGVRLNSIVAFQVFLDHPTVDITLEFSRFRLIPRLTTSWEGLIDPFGQYASSEWPGKVHSEDEIRQAGYREVLDWDAFPPRGDCDRWGGWAGGPVLGATGYFHTDQQNGRWWLVDPEGRLFLSFGMDALRPSAPTIVHPRDEMFQSLPTPTEPLGKYWGTTSGVLYGPATSGRTYDFFEANLERKFGRDFRPAWREESLRRLVSWGFNTIGNWSEEALTQEHRVPYVTSFTIGGPHARVSSGSDYWGRMPDPFDPRFAQDCADSFQEAVKYGKDPWLLGYFVDNELSWSGGALDQGRWGLAWGTLAAPEDQPARQFLLTRLKMKYKTLEVLNHRWNTAFPSWEAIAPPSPGTIPNEAWKDDMSEFLLRFAEKYFSVVRGTLKHLDPNHLYLGCRFAWSTPEALQAANESCDVVSFNVYQRTVDPENWNPGPLSKPALIGEFHFGALDRGLFHPGLVPTANQKERADAFRAYVESVLANPRLVGAHWFQYTDEPTTGRVLDGENYNIGFVSVVDVPYPEMVSAARSVFREIYHR